MGYETSALQPVETFWTHKRTYLYTHSINGYFYI